MISHTIYSVNRWLAEQLGGYAPVAFMEEQELALPGFRVVWNAEKEAAVRPGGILSGARFTVYCLAPGDQAHSARALAAAALSVLRSVRGRFGVPRYLYPPEPGAEPRDYIALRDLASREMHLPEHPELAVHIVQATALTINPPLAPAQPGR